MLTSKQKFDRLCMVYSLVILWVGTWVLSFWPGIISIDGGNYFSNALNRPGNILTFESTLYGFYQNSIYFMIPHIGASIIPKFYLFLGALIYGSYILAFRLNSLLLASLLPIFTALFPLNILSLLISERDFLYGLSTTICGLICLEIALIISEVKITQLLWHFFAFFCFSTLSIGIRAEGLIVVFCYIFLVLGISRGVGKKKIFIAQFIGSICLSVLVINGLSKSLIQAQFPNGNEEVRSLRAVGSLSLVSNIAYIWRKDKSSLTSIELKQLDSLLMPIRLNQIDPLLGRISSSPWLRQMPATNSALAKYLLKQIFRSPYSFFEYRFKLIGNSLSSRIYSEDLYTQKLSFYNRGIPIEFERISYFNGLWSILFRYVDQISNEGGVTPIFFRLKPVILTLLALPFFFYWAPLTFLMSIAPMSQLGIVFLSQPSGNAKYIYFCYLATFFLIPLLILELNGRLKVISLTKENQKEN